MGVRRVLSSVAWPSASSWHDQQAAPLCPAFSLLPEVREAGYRLTPRARIELMMRRWRREPLFGVIENKLLSHTLLASLHVPRVTIVYGAFATKSLGRWPKYDREYLEDAIAGLGPSSSRAFVLKSATNGGGADVLLMTPERWRSEGWSMRNVTAYAEKFLRTRWYSEWGQRYEHRGVVVQSTFGEAGSGTTIELKVHVAFGQLGSGRVYLMPKDDSMHLEISFCEMGRVACSGLRCVGGKDACVAQCEKSLSMLTKVALPLNRLVRAASSLLGADWLRIDVFVSQGANGSMSWVVNEITYPSHIERNASSCCSFARLLRVYRDERWLGMNATAVLAEVMRRAKVGSDFLTTPDYLTLEHAEERVYDSQIWQWSPDKGKSSRFEHRSHARGRGRLNHRTTDQNRSVAARADGRHDE